MEKMNFIYFCLGALSLFVGMLLYPTLQRVFTRIKSMFKRKSRSVASNEMEMRLTRLEKQVNEALKYAKKRDSDRTSKTKQIVLEYLKELKNE